MTTMLSALQIILVLCLVAPSIQVLTSHLINIALHAQLHPSADKVVGSVITTNGLRAAFRRRPDVNEVDIFYPSRYEGFLNRTWDVVMIEGWFPSIDTFLALTRNNFPKCKIVFICLDPIYPGIETVAKFAVDGIVTNSRELLPYFGNDFPTEHMMLAADPSLMRPYTNVTRSWGTIYVGAGGHMLQIKPELRGLLLQALPYGLRLHGSNWESSADFQSVTQGPLPELALAPAYSSAQVVLASTIQAQSTFGMVNNRIFEALSCGAVVVSMTAPELQNLHCDALLLINDTHSLPQYMNMLLSDPEQAARLRESGRDFILRGHTWGHRAVQLIDFLHHSLHAHTPPLALPSAESDSTVSVRDRVQDVCGAVKCLGRNCPSLLWLVSPHLLTHQDYTFVARNMGPDHLCGLFQVTVITPEEAFSEAHKEQLRQFRVILAFITPFDALDRAMRGLGLLSIPDRAFPEQWPHAQKHVAYLIGYDPALVLDFLQDSERQEGAREKSNELSFTHYDAVWYRSLYDVQQLMQVATELPPDGRWQHMFGVGSTARGVAQTDEKRRRRRVVVVCFFTAASQCGASSRTQLLRRVQEEYYRDESVGEGLNAGEDMMEHVLLLLGGTWDAWLHEEVSGTRAVPLEDIHRTVHVRDGWTGAAVELVQDAEVVLVMNAPGPAVPLTENVAACAESDIAVGVDGKSTLNPSGLATRADRQMQCQVGMQTSSTDDVLWPLVAAAVAGARIHLQHAHPHYAHLFADGEAGSWSRDFFVDSMLKVGCNRLLGLGSRHSRLDVLPVTADSAFAQSFLESKNSGHDAQRAEEADTLVWWELAYSSFQVGRDGEACLEQANRDDLGESTQDSAAGTVGKHKSWNTPGERVCLMRPYRYIALRGSPQKSLWCSRPPTLSLFLRGPFFADPFYSIELSQEAFYRQGNVMSVPAAWNNTWMTAQNAFVYNVGLCL